MYELEKQRRMYLYEGISTYDTIKTSDSIEELEELAKNIMIRSGKTFHEVLVINEINDDGDVEDVRIIKEN